jgi:hypothetical protein
MRTGFAGEINGIADGRWQIADFGFGSLSDFCHLQFAIPHLLLSFAPQND